MSGFWPREIEFDLRDMTTVFHIIEEQNRKK